MLKYAFSITIFLIGFVIAWISTQLPDINNFSLSNLGSSFGSFVCSSALFSFYLQWKGREETLRQVYSEIGIAYNLKEAGIQSATKSSEKQSLSEHIKRAKHIRVAYLYSDRFLKDYHSDLIEALKSGARIDLIFLKRDSASVRLLQESGWSREEIQASYISIDRIFNELRQYGKISINYHSNPRANSIIQIDDIAVVSMVSLSNGRIDVPRLTVKKGGQLFEFIVSDLDRLEQQYV